MKIELQNILKNNKFWMQKVCLWEYNPKIKINNKKYNLVGINNYHKLHKPHLIYQSLDDNGKTRSKRIGLEKVNFIYIEDDFEKEIKKKINSIKSST